jgi:hypothetical protein
MSETIQAGDRVVCIDDYASFGRLRKGDIFTAELAYDNHTVVVVVQGGYCSIERFKKITREVTP